MSRPLPLCAFVTGSVTGIGEGLVNKLHSEGWLVFAGYRKTQPSTASWHGKDGVIPIQCDITKPEQIEAAAHLVRQQCGRLDLLFNNAGYPGNSGVIEAANMNDYRHTFEVNLWGPMMVAQAFIPLLKQAKGKVVNVTSASVYLTVPMGSSYPVAKTALKALSNHMRLEMAPFGVQVCSLEPGGVETPMTELGDNVSEAQWSTIPEPLRSEYRKHFCDGASAISEGFELYSVTEFADTVYRKIISGNKLKPSYLIGPKSSALPWLHRLLPQQQVLNIWAKMFSVKN